MRSCLRTLATHLNVNLNLIYLRAKHRPLYYVLYDLFTPGVK